MTPDPAKQKAEVFCDTSVLISYVLDQGVEEAQRLILESDFEKVISEKVEEEFQRVPDRKDDIYYDFLEIITSNDDDVVQQKAEERDYLKPNDVGFFQRLRDDLAEGESMKEKMRILRERQKIADRRFGRVQEIVGDPLPRNDDIELLLRLGQEIENEDDCQVVCDAVDWSLNGGSGNFATLDKHDLLRHGGRINRAIESKRGESGTLEISHPSHYLSL